MVKFVTEFYNSRSCEINSILPKIKSTVIECKWMFVFAYFLFLFLLIRKSMLNFRILKFKKNGKKNIKNQICIQNLQCTSHDPNWWRDEEMKRWRIKHWTYKNAGKCTVHSFINGGFDPVSRCFIFAYCLTEVWSSYC